MRIRRLSLVVVVTLLMPVPAWAHDHVADFLAAFCFAKGSNLFGVQQTLAITVPPDMDPDPNERYLPLSIVFDTSMHMGEHNDDPRTRVAIMTGVRYTFTQLVNPQRHLLNAHFLVGGLRDGGVTTTGHKAIAFGGGYEYLGNGDPHGWGIRTQLDYLKAFDDGESFPRFSVGFVYRK